MDKVAAILISAYRQFLKGTGTLRYPQLRPPRAEMTGVLSMKLEAGILQGSWFWGATDFLVIWMADPGRGW